MGALVARLGEQRIVLAFGVRVEGRLDLLVAIVQRARAAVEGVQLAADLFAEGHEGVAGRADEEHGAEVNRCAADVLCEHATAEAALRLQDDDAMAEFAQLLRRAQPRAARGVGADADARRCKEM